MIPLDVRSEVLKKALDRGHEVTAIAGNTGKISIENDLLITAEVDVKEIGKLAKILNGLSTENEPILFFNAKAMAGSLTMTSVKIG